MADPTPAAPTAKVVDIIAPGGVTLNYTGMTGLRYNLTLPVSLIKKAIERGCVVYELKDDGTRIEPALTLDTVEKANGGATVAADALIPPDMEDLRAKEIEEEDEERVKAAGEYYKKYFEELKKLQGDTDSGTTTPPTTGGDGDKGDSGNTGGSTTKPPTTGGDGSTGGTTTPTTPDKGDSGSSGSTTTTPDTGSGSTKTKAARFKR